VQGIRAAEAEIAAFAAASGLPRDALWRFHVALDELISNVARHGAPGSDVGLEFRLEGGVLEVTVTDGAPAFNPLEASPPATSALRDRPRTSDAVEHSCSKDGPAVGVMRRRRPGGRCAAFTVSGPGPEARQGQLARGLDGEERQEAGQVEDLAHRLFHRAQQQLAAGVLHPPG